eukprot:360326-Chlamydomonas_euryale.AAC.3
MASIRRCFAAMHCLHGMEALLRRVADQKQTSFAVFPSGNCNVSAGLSGKKAQEVWKCDLDIQSRLATSVVELHPIHALTSRKRFPGSAWLVSCGKSTSDFPEALVRHELTECKGLLQRNAAFLPVAGCVGRLGVCHAHDQA